MPNTYTQIHLQIVFAVKYRQGLIEKAWKDDLYKYITGTIQSYDHKMLAINGVEDHIHILIGMRPTQSLSDLLQDIKSGSSKWINDNKLTKRKFAWQEGYGAFSYSKSHVPNVIRYIHNQEEHHRKKSFLEEYDEFLKKFEVDYDRRYIFKEPE
ncbi:MAG: IS200/IS605 family transposase [Imperialibacter sp.]|uniref:IS200/IS605 family transposase n=1 Tax=Imperialibacter sp. TaxID=2038411 RepID=UPI0032ED0906